LIDRFYPFQNAQILDLACGRGGDMSKWKRREPSRIMFLDISLESLKVCFRRFQQTFGRHCIADFILGDSFHFPLSQIFPNLKFHLSSCQFALHYSFKSQQDARSAVQVLSSNIYEGGYIILTLPNAEHLITLFQKALPSRKICNGLFSAERRFELNDIPQFGAEYIFYLENTVFHVPEYLVHFESLIQLFSEHDVELVEHNTFPSYYQKYLQPNRNKDHSFSRIIDHNDMLLDDGKELEICGLYSYFVFRKKGELPPMPENTFRPQTHFNSEMSI
jgi:mRNA (guanine-N7-)-methyltransferase